jgi:hypothetical protein
MTDRCDGLSNQRVRNYSEATCEPSAEEAATKEASSQQGTEREAEARRNAYFASGTDEGGRSSRASSDPRALETSSKYDQRDKNARLAEYYTRIDRPLQDDVAGNALVGAIGAGAVAGIAAATKAGATAAAGALARAAADGAAKSLVTTVRNDALVGVYDASRRGVGLPSSITEPAAAAPSTSAEVGRSSKRGASEIVPEPVRSEAPRIPEALPPLPVRIQG